MYSFLEIYLKNNGLLSFNYTIQVDNQASNNWLSINKNSGSLSITDTDTVIAKVETSGLGFGNIDGKLIVGKENSTNDTISLLLFVKDTISSLIDPKQIVDTLWAGDNSFYKILLKNTGLHILNYNLQIDSQTPSEWLTINKSSGSLLSENTDTITAYIETSGLSIGNLNCNLIVERESRSNDTIQFLLLVNDTLTSEITPSFIIDTLNQNISKIYHHFLELF